MEHPAWVHNTQTERFSDCDKVIQRRWGKLLQTQRNTEWLDMAAARLVIIKKLTRKRLARAVERRRENDQPGGIPQSGKMDRRKSEADPVGVWFKTYRENPSEWVGGAQAECGKENKENRTKCRIPPYILLSGGLRRRYGHSMPEYENLYGPRVLRKNVRAFLRKVHTEWRESNAPVRLDESIRTIESFPWHLLRNPAIST